jgi:outer membrane immunogenic protein
MLNGDQDVQSMRSVLLASSALIVSAHVAAAQPYIPANPILLPPAGPYSWTGCYVGGHAGPAWDRTTLTDPFQQNIAPPGRSVGVNGQGFLHGVQAGCDYQFARHWVIGLAGDFSWANIAGQGNDPFFAGKNGNPITLSSRTDWLASVTGRLGYSWDRYLLYVRGGAAWADNHYTAQNLQSVNGNDCGTFPFFVACNPSGGTTRWGWVAGIGFEWSFATNWSAMVEYNHYGFGGRDVSLIDPNAGLGNIALLNVAQDVNMVRIGINYRFWSPGLPLPPN